MAKATKMNRKKADTVVHIKGNHGTDPSLVVKTFVDDERVKDRDGWLLYDCVAKDDNGYYMTKMSYVNSSVLDPNRCYRRVQPSDELIESIEVSNGDKEETQD